MIGRWLIIGLWEGSCFDRSISVNLSETAVLVVLIKRCVNRVVDKTRKA